MPDGVPVFGDGDHGYHHRGEDQPSQGRGNSSPQCDDNPHSRTFDPGHKEDREQPVATCHTVSDEVGDGPTQTKGDCLSVKERDELIDGPRPCHFGIIGNRSWRSTSASRR